MVALRADFEDEKTRRRQAEMNLTVSTERLLVSKTKVMLVASNL